MKLKLTHMLHLVESGRNSLFSLQFVLKRVLGNRIGSNSSE